MNISRTIRFNLTGGKVNDDQATTESDPDIKIRKRALFKNTNDEKTHQETADKAETILNPKK